MDKNYDEEVFWVFVHIMLEKGWRRVYMDGTPKLMELLQELEKRMEKELPVLYKLLIDQVTITYLIVVHILSK